MRSRGLKLAVLFLIIFPFTAAAKETPVWFDGTPVFGNEAAEAAAAYGTGSPSKIKQIQDALGETRSFWAYNFSGGNYYQLNATLKAVTANAYVYVQLEDSAGNDVWNDGSAWTGYITQADATAIANEFNDSTYSCVREAFSDELQTGVDGDSHVTILLLDIDNDYAKNLSSYGSYVAGYYTYLNEYSTAIYSYSNQRKMIYIDTFPLIERGNTTHWTPTTDHSSTGEGANESYSVLAHEFQHMIHWRHDPNEETWVNEGCSMLAQWKCGYGHSWAHINEFKRDTDNSLTSWSGTLADYGKTYLWTLYFYEQNGGSNAIGKLVNESANGITGINNVLAALPSPYSNYRFHNLFRWWTVANYVDDATINNGQFGYQNINVTVSSTMVHSGIHLPYPQYGVNASVRNWAADYVRFMVTTGSNNLSLRFNGTAGNFTLWMVKKNTNTNATAVEEINLTANNTGSTRITSFGPTYNSVVMIPSFSNYVDTGAAHNYSYASNGSNITGITVLEFGRTGTGEGEFRQPKGIAVDLQTERIYVSDTQNNRVEVFDLEGNFIDSFGSFGDEYLEFDSPGGIGVDESGSVYIADTENDQIKVYDRNLAYVMTIGSNTPDEGELDGNFLSPADVSFDQYGNMVVADKVNHRVQKLNSTGGFLAKYLGFENPKGVHVDLFNKIYVADTNNHRIRVLKENGSLNFTTGSDGTGNGNYSYPEGVAVDYSGFIYVADTQNSRIQVLNPNGSFNTSYGSLGTQLGNFTRPAAVEVDSVGRVYVADTDNNRVQIFKVFISDKAEVYALRSDIALDNQTPRELQYVWMNITIRNVGNDNATNFTVKVYENNSNGTLIDSRVLTVTSGATQTFETVWRARLNISRIAVLVDTNDVVNESNEYNNDVWNFMTVIPLTPNFTVSGLNQSRGVFADSDGRIYLAERGNNVIRVYNRTGGLNATIGNSTLLDDPADVAVNSTGYIFVANSDPDMHNIAVFSPNGAYLGTFKNESDGIAEPQGLYIDQNNRIYIANTNNHNVVVYNPDGSEHLSVGSYGSGNGQLNTPMDVAADSHGRIIVSDRSNNRIEVFNPDGSFNMTFGSLGNETGKFNNTHGIYVDRDDVIYVVDKGNNRIQLFNPNGSLNFTFNGNNTMNAPEGVAVDGSGRVYVANTANETLLGFDVYTETQDSTPPAVTLTSPADAWTSNSSNITLNYTVTDANTIVNCSLYLNSSVLFRINQTRSNITAGANHFNLTNVRDGYYTWNIECTDNQSNSGMAPSNQTFQVDTTIYPPAILSATPENNTVYPPYTTNITVNITTNVTAVCKWSNTSGVSYVNMTNAFNQTNSTNHTLYLTNLSNNQNTTLHIRCGRAEGVNNTQDHVLHYRVSSPNITLNEIMPAGSEWIELYNSGETEVNLTGWAIAGTASGNNIEITGAVSYHGFLVRNLTGTLLAINETYDTVLLYDRDATQVDNHAINASELNASWTAIPENYSVGRTTDGGGNWSVFNSSQASPGESNAGTQSIETTLQQGWNLISIPLNL